MTQQAEHRALALSDKDGNYYVIPEAELARFQVSDEDKAKLEVSRGEVQAFSWAGWSAWGMNWW